MKIGKEGETPRHDVGGASTASLILSSDPNYKPAAVYPISQDMYAKFGSPRVLNNVFLSPGR